MRILNLYAGMGGNRKLWKGHQITAIENKQEIADLYHEFFPEDIVIVTDAHKYLLEHLRTGEYDFVWSSPPCPTHSRVRPAGVYSGQTAPMYPDMKLYEEIIYFQYFAPSGVKWVVENVVPYYDPLIRPSIVIDRHLFWSNFHINRKSFSVDNTINDMSWHDTHYGFSLEGRKIGIRKDRLLRNLVNPEIGLYVLEQSQKGIKKLF